MAGTPSPLDGTFEAGTFTVDGQAHDAFDDPSAWQADADDGPELGLSAGQSTGTVLDVDSRGRRATAGLVPRGTPDIPPAVAARDAPTLGVGGDTSVSTGPTAEYRLRRVETAEALPVVGSTGVMADLTTMTRASPESSQRHTMILADDDTPAAVVRELADAGVRTTDPKLLSDVRADYDNEAYALALRLYLLAAAGTLALAVIGVVVSLAVQVRSRRKDAAALRVAGVRERAVWFAGVLELCTVTTVAALVGALAGAGVAQVVVRSTDLGAAGVGAPRVLTDLDVPTLALLCAAVLGVLAVVSVVVARTVVRSGRPSTLREA